MERLLSHIDAISRQRNRSQLEARLVAALYELCGAQRVGLYKLFAPPGEFQVGLAAEHTGKGLRLLDDGISWPAGTGPLERVAHLQACWNHGGHYADSDAASGLRRNSFAIRGSALKVFGFVTLLTALPLDAAKTGMVDGLLALFRNCLALLDYSEIDTLTGLLNRKTFDEYLINILSHVGNGGDAQAATLRLPRRRRAQAQTIHHWLGVIDIDHFKRINDKFGHLIGDEVLILVANLMKSTFRAQDKLFRFGGEEFVVLLKPTEVENAQAIFERYRKEIEDFRFPQVEHVTVSAGFTRIELYDTPSMILDDADEALYYAKEHGRNQVCCYEDLIDSGALVKHQVMHTDAELF